MATTTVSLACDARHQRPSLMIVFSLACAICFCRSLPSLVVPEANTHSTTHRIAALVSAESDALTSRGCSQGKRCQPLWPRVSPASRSSSVARRSLAEPPTILRPPDVGTVASDAAEWTECLLEDRGLPQTSKGQPGWTIDEGSAPGAATSAAAAAAAMTAGRKGDSRFFESWVFRTSDFGDFERLLKIRQFNPEQVSLQCRERSIDAELRCAECIRLLRGGHYGTLGISVAAYPPQKSAVGCLQLSKTLEVEAEATVWGSPMSMGELGMEQRQTAFCNSVNAQFAKVA